MYPQSMPTEWTHARTLRPWQRVRELGTSVEQPSVVKFFFRIAIFCAFGRESRKGTGGVKKYAKFRHFLAHRVVKEGQE